MGDQLRVVFDCNVMLQAVASPAGPAFACLCAANAHPFVLLICEEVLEEYISVMSRPRVQRKLPSLTDARIAKFVTDIRGLAAVVGPTAHAVSFPRDPKDEPYLNLVVAGNADVLVTRDRDFSDPSLSEALQSCRLLTPEQFLQELASRGS